jgi:hypothetical protein
MFVVIYAGGFRQRMDLARHGRSVAKKKMQHVSMLKAEAKPRQSQRNSQEEMTV